MASAPAGMPREHTTEIEVRYAETDQMGVVHHSNYLVWFELARTRLCATTPLPYPEIERHGYWLMVIGAQLSYRGAARYGDRVEVRCWIDRLANRLLHFAYEVRRGDELLVRGRTEHAWVNAATGKTCRMPELVRGVFEELAGKSVGSGTQSP